MEKDAVESGLRWPHFHESLNRPPCFLTLSLKQKLSLESNLSATWHWRKSDRHCFNLGRPMTRPNPGRKTPPLPNPNCSTAAPSHLVGRSSVMAVSKVDSSQKKKSGPLRTCSNPTASLWSGNFSWNAAPAPSSSESMAVTLRAAVDSAVNELRRPCRNSAEADLRSAVFEELPVTTVMASTVRRATKTRYKTSIKTCCARQTSLHFVFTAVWIRLFP
mmetsp:Transcript_16193/g.54614  ORF Transcript_16193/g.54614 Transcript_16193/m.54614 type:complete len:218 (-) Transcript_16193:152-805(-)